jgi:hypothetical protein
VSGSAVSEARETSGATTGLLLSYVRQQGGDDAVAEVLRRAGVPFTAAELELPSHWTSYDTRIKLFTAATEVLGDRQTMFRVGREALALGLTPALVLLVRAMGSPRQVYRQLPRAVAKFSTTSTMRVVESGATHATLSYRLRDGYEHSRLDCEYAQGLIGMVPTIFGLPPAELVHLECESDGHPVCVYHLTWERRRRLGGRRRSDDDVAELLALREQLRILQSAAADLVASEDVETVLQRIIEKAAEAVLAPGWLLAVADPAGGPALVRSAGLPQHQVDALAATLMAGADPGPNVVAVDVASAGCTAGWPRSTGPATAASSTNARCSAPTPATPRPPSTCSWRWRAPGRRPTAPGRCSPSPTGWPAPPRPSTSARWSPRPCPGSSAATAPR